MYLTYIVMYLYLIFLLQHSHKTSAEGPDATTLLWLYKAFRLLAPFPFLQQIFFFFGFTINQVQPEVQTTVVLTQLYKLLRCIFYTGNNKDTHSTPFFA